MVKEQVVCQTKWMTNPPMTSKYFPFIKKQTEFVIEERTWATWRENIAVFTIKWRMLNRVNPDCFSFIHLIGIQGKFTTGLVCISSQSLNKSKQVGCHPQQSIKIIVTRTINYVTQARNRLLLRLSLTVESMLQDCSATQLQLSLRRYPLLQWC